MNALETLSALNKALAESLQYGVGILAASDVKALKTIVGKVEKRVAAAEVSKTPVLDSIRARYNGGAE